MVASLLRVVHSGPQNERLQDPQDPQDQKDQQHQQHQQPSVKFFQKIFKRAGRFTTQWERLDFNTQPNFGQQGTISLLRKGHLLSRLYLVTNYPTVQNTNASWTNSIGHALIQSAELQIGGARIEQLDGQLMEVLDEFNTPLEKVPVVNRLLGRHENNYKQFTGITSNTTVTSNTIITEYLDVITNTFVNYYWQPTSNLIVTSNTGYTPYWQVTPTLVITSNLVVISNYADTFSNTIYYNTQQIFPTGTNFDVVPINTSVPMNYMSNTYVDINYNFQLSVSDSFIEQPDSNYIYIDLERIGSSGQSILVKRDIFSNIAPPTSFDSAYNVTISNIQLYPGQIFQQRISGYYESGGVELAFSNQGMQISFTYETTDRIYTSNYVPTSNYVNTYTLESNYYVNYFSNYTYSSNLQSNYIYTYTSNYTYSNTGYTITSNYTTISNFSYANALSNPLTTTTPLPFFFCRGDAATALPVDAIQADEIRLQIAFRPFTSLYTIPQGLSNAFLSGFSNGLVTGTFSNSISYAQITENTNCPDNANNAASGNNSTGYKGRGDAEGSAIPSLGNTPPKLGDTYLLAEYIYLDAPEANRFRIADISLPITQHYTLQPYDTQGLPNAQLQIAAPNPVRDIFFYCQPWNAPSYNAHFLATKYIGPTATTLDPWWPDAEGLNPLYPATLKPAFYPDKYDSEPIATISLQYEGRLTKFSTGNPALFRSILPSLEQKKSPWINRYYYNIPLGLQHGITDRTRPTGEANYDKITRRELQLTFGKDSSGAAPRLWVRCWAETYNMLRIYGGRAGTLFGY